MIELREISKRFGPLDVIHSLTLLIESNATTVLIGPSGSGKSTLLRLMVGLERPDGGEILFRGQRLVPASFAEVRRKMGYVIQEGGLFPHLSAGANVALMARYLSREESRIKARMEELAVLCRLPREALRRYPAQLSGGERQRVSLMRALMLDPDLLLLDEPLGSLDPLIRAELQGDLKAIFRTLKKTVLLVTHDMGEAMYFGDRVVLLHQGRIVQQGPPEELLAAPADPFVTRFINAQRGFPLPQRSEP